MMKKRTRERRGRMNETFSFGRFCAALGGISRD